MTNRTLPTRPNLEFYRSQARALLRQAGAGNPQALTRFRQNVPRLAQPLPGRLKLADALHAIAREHGFPSWPKFKVHLATPAAAPPPEIPLSAVAPASDPTEIRKEVLMTPESLNNVAGMSTAAVKKATGKGWAEWIALLDQEAAQTMKHKGIAALLGEKHSCPGWWAQMITVGYEQAHGLRVKHQKCDGTFEANASKTIKAPLAKLFAAVADDKLRKQWLSGKLEITKATQDKSVRARCGKNPVSINFYAKGDSKSMIQLQLLKLKDADEVAWMKAFWRDRLAALTKLLEK